MGTIRVKNALNRPRVFSVVDAEGYVDAIRFRSGEVAGIEVRLLTQEIAENIRKGYLLLLDGKLPDKLNPYPEKGTGKAALETADVPEAREGESAPQVSEESDKGGKKVIKKGAKTDG